MKLFNWFIRHPASVGETYGQHLIAAVGFGLKLVAGGLGCLVHAVIPELFARAGSDCVASLHARLTERRRTADADSAPAQTTNQR